jgi:hypothetical protein
MNPEQIVHPLATIKTIQTDQRTKEVINSWGFGSRVLAAALEENSNAMSIIQEPFPDQTQILSLLSRSQQGDEAAIREAIALLAFGLEHKATEAFGKL